MIKTLIVLFSASSLSFGSRLLLQNAGGSYVPWPVEPATPAQPAIEPQLPVEPAQPQAPEPPVGGSYVPWPVDPAQPAQPQSPEPVPPNQYVPVEPQIPAQPAQPQAPQGPQSPQYVPIDPAQPAQPGQPVIPQYALPAVAPPKTECKESPPHPSSCAGKPQTINNPSQNWELLCDGRYGCAATQFNINIGPNANPLMESMKGFWFVNEFAAAGAIININNQRPGDKIMIDEITCDKPGSCFNTQFIIGTMMEIDQGNFYCAPQACDGCVVKESLIDPGLPCTEFVEPI